jgi:hypothetical protein
MKNFEYAYQIKNGYGQDTWMFDEAFFDNFKDLTDLAKSLTAIEGACTTVPVRLTMHFFMKEDQSVIDLSSVFAQRVKAAILMEMGLNLISVGSRTMKHVGKYPDVLEDIDDVCCLFSIERAEEPKHI